MRVLWLDNDLSYVAPYVKHLKKHDHDVTAVATVPEAEALLRSHRFDLLVLDVMIPPFDAAEEEDYPTSETLAGHQTGLAFAKKWLGKLREGGTAVVIHTVRLDTDIRQRFAELGLGPESFATKLSLRDVNEFRAFIERQGGR